MTELRTFVAEARAEVDERLAEMDEVDANAVRRRSGRGATRTGRR